MRKLLAFLLVICMALALTACSEQPADGSDGAGPDDGTAGKVLVAYFSCTGGTEGIAGYIADALDAELYRIVPAEPYTDEDLDYSDHDTRATLEQNDDAARPAISGTVRNMDEYDVIFIGYPIWWSEAPKIVYTFVESYEMSGKTLIPFCTSGSSPIGSSAAHMHGLAPDANWMDGARFSADASRSSVEKWLAELGL